MTDGAARPARRAAGSARSSAAGRGALRGRAGGREADGFSRGRTSWRPREETRAYPTRASPMCSAPRSGSSRRSMSWLQPVGSVTCQILSPPSANRGLRRREKLPERRNLSLKPRRESPGSRSHAQSGRNRRNALLQVALQAGARTRPRAAAGPRGCTVAPPAPQRHGPRCAPPAVHPRSYEPRAAEGTVLHAVVRRPRVSVAVHYAASTTTSSERSGTQPATRSTRSRAGARSAAHPQNGETRV